MKSLSEAPPSAAAVKIPRAINDNGQPCMKYENCLKMDKGVPMANAKEIFEDQLDM